MRKKEKEKKLVLQKSTLLVFKLEEVGGLGWYFASLKSASCMSCSGEIFTEVHKMIFTFCHP